MGQDNLEGIAATLEGYGIDAEWERTGELDIAVEPWQVDGLHESADLLSEQGRSPRVMPQDEIQSLVHSPTYLAAIHDPDGVAMVHPAKLAWGLRQACLDLGVRIYEQTEVTGLSDERAGLTVRSAYGSVQAKKVALVTNSATSLLRRLSNFVVPVYDYVLMTEPSSPACRRVGPDHGRPLVRQPGSVHGGPRTPRDLHRRDPRHADRRGFIAVPPAEHRGMRRHR